MGSVHNTDLDDSAGCTGCLCSSIIDVSMFASDINDYMTLSLRVRKMPIVGGNAQPKAYFYAVLPLLWKETYAHQP